MKPRGLAIGLVLQAIVASAAADAATFIEYTVSADFGFDGFHRFVSSAEGSFTTYRYGEGRFLQLYFSPDSGSDETFAYVHVGPPAGQALAVGTYEGATQDQGAAPFLEAGPSRASCGNRPSRFTVHEIAFDAGGELAVLSIDFEQLCSDGTRISGSARYRTGDDACPGNDGATCDDGDTCTAGDVCQGGECRGVDGVTPTCTADGLCRVGGTCDRGSGGCRPIERQNGVTCDDGGACRLGTVCEQGVCGGGTPLACDDGSRCTTERCDPALGCVVDPEPGHCLVAFVEVSAVATASAAGQTVVCKLRCAAKIESTLFLYDDDTYRILGGTSGSCPSGTLVEFPDEIGAVVPARRGKHRLQPANLDVLREANRRCAGTRKPPRLPVMTLTGDPSNPALTGQTVLRTRRLSRGIPVQVAVKSRYQFRDGVMNGTAVHPVPFALPECAPGLSARCRRR